jgi:hypothetical protein
MLRRIFGYKRTEKIIDLNEELHNLYCKGKGKGKDIPVTGRGGS